METTNIVRRSVHLFLKHYLFFTTIAAILFFPASASILISMYGYSSRLTPRLVFRIQSLFDAGEFSSSRFTSFLILKTSQTIASFFIYLPSTITFLLLAKACVIIHVLRSTDPTCKTPYSSLFDSLPLAWNKLFVTYITSIAIIFALNSIAVSFMFLAFNSLDMLSLPTPITTVLFSFGAIFCAIFLANTLITCNLAMVVSGIEDCSGIVAILRACILIKDKAATALTLGLIVNICLAAIEALFYYRVVKSYKLSHAITVVWEAPLLFYMYSIVLLIDTTTACIFYTNSKSLYLYERKCGKEDEGSKDYLSLPAQLP